MLVLIPLLVSSLPLQLSQSAAIPKRAHFGSVLGPVPKTQGVSRIAAKTEETSSSLSAAAWSD